MNHSGVHKSGYDRYRAGSGFKNVIALAAGMADGLGFGDNTKAALITRGIKEIARLAIEMGAKGETLFRSVRDRRPYCNLRKQAQQKPQSRDADGTGIYNG